MKSDHPDAKIPTSCNNSPTSKKKRRHGLVTTQIPTVHFDHFKRNFGSSGIRLLQERLAYTIHSVSDAMHHRINRSQMWPSCPWHYRALIIQYKSTGGNKLVDLNTAFIPWIANSQYPKGSTDERVKFSVNLIYELYEPFSQCAKLWGIPMGGIIQDTVEDMLLTNHYYEKKLAHWRKLWDTYCEQQSQVCKIWDNHFDALQNLWTQDGKPYSNIPNIQAYYKRIGRNF